VQLKKNKTILFVVAVVFSPILFAQTRFSFATNASLQKNFKKDQRFHAVGQDLIFNWHFTAHIGAYASFSYYSTGKFKNNLSAAAKSPGTLPQQIFFTNNARVSLKQISIGWKHYLVGSSDAETGWNLYGAAGFGIIFGKAVNNYSTAIDTSLYAIPQQPVNGSGHFKRLSLDLALGWELPLGADIYLYSEARMWIPTTDYPSKYLFVNNNAPLAGMITAGLRLLF
jgi:hypothetical protein